MSRNREMWQQTLVRIMIELGTNRPVQRDICAIVEAAKNTLRANRQKKRTIPPLWDGRTAERIVDYLEMP